MADKLLTAAQLIDMLKLYNHTELQVHHTWKPNHSNFTGKNYQKLQDGMRNHHMKNNKWSDIAQHVTLYPDGKFLTGRPFNQSPAGIVGHNAGTFMVEMVGDFDIGKDKFEGPQKEAMLQLARFFYSRGKYIRFHRENAAKSCPGTGIDKNEFMRAVKNAPSATVETPKPKEKEEVRMYKPTNQESVTATSKVLLRLSDEDVHGDKAISPIHRDNLLKGKLSESDAIAIIYVALERGMINGGAKQ